jgi:hypothetical protein
MPKEEEEKARKVQGYRKCTIVLWGLKTISRLNKNTLQIKKIPDLSKCEILYWRFFLLKSVEKIQISLKSDTNIGHFTRRLRHVLNCRQPAASETISRHAAAAKNTSLSEL